MSGILFGTKATLSKDLYQALVATGTLHIIALSGMNITILINLVSLALLRLVSRRIASLLTIAIVVGFVWFVGASASVVRAAIMGSISLLAVIFGRQYWAFLSWTLAVGIMLLLNFDWLGDLSFQLSALATLGIILFGNDKTTGAYRGSLFDSSRQGPIGSFPLGSGAKAVTGLEKTRRAAPLDFFGESAGIPRRRETSALSKFLIWQGLKENLRLTLAAQAFTIPLILWKFQRISVISPLTNILIGWIIQPITVLGLVTALVGWIFLPLGQLVAWTSWVPLQYLISVVELTAKIPGASFGW
ncbi:ComEC/Rec2 family competence protein [Candidatus Gottesmanbacteria bacterium]|nr:ComEC/Rec2 family competence protein [Candidatus Gottesmanbacteria bacterium]